MVRWGDHPAFLTIVEDITAMLEDADREYEAGDRLAFTQAIRNIKLYQPTKKKEHHGKQTANR